MSPIHPYDYYSDYYRQANLLSDLHLSRAQPKTRVQANLPSVSGLDIPEHLQVRQTSDQGCLALFEKIISNIGLLYVNEYYRQLHFISYLNLIAAQQASRENASLPSPSIRRGGISDDSQLRQTSDQGCPLVPKSLLHPGLLPPGMPSIHSLKGAAATTNDEGKAQSATFCELQLVAKQPQKEGYHQHEENLSTRSKDGFTERKQKIREYDTKYRETHKEKLAERHKQYQAANKEKISQFQKTYQKKYRLENRERLAEKRKEYREKHKDKITEHNKQYWLSNKVKLSERNKRYFLENKEKIAKRRKWRYLLNKKKQELALNTAP